MEHIVCTNNGILKLGLFIERSWERKREIEKERRDTVGGERGGGGRDYSRKLNAEWGGRS